MCYIYYNDFKPYVNVKEDGLYLCGATALTRFGYTQLLSEVGEFNHPRLFDYQIQLY